MADIAGFRCRPMSGRVGSAIFESGIVENVGVAVGIASLTLPVRVIFQLPVFSFRFSLPVPWPTFRVFDVGKCRAVSTMPFLSRA